VATAEEHARLYGEVRAQALSRFFAYSRYFRANQVFLWNYLGHLRSEADGRGEADSARLPCRARLISRPAQYDPIVVNGVEEPPERVLAGLPDHELERWRIAFHYNENPHLFGTYLMVALACEHALGSQTALPILRLAIDTLGRLYKYDGAFAGYPLRYDAVSSDHWETREDPATGRPLPVRCCSFYLDADYRYLWCAPSTYPGYMPQPDRTTPGDEWERWRAQYRGHEPSMDEILGLVCTYSFVNALVDDPALRAAIRAQVMRLGDYLARFGYILVRPCGGFAAKGASGLLPALEYPFGRVFERIAGDRFRSRASFEDAMRAGGAWDCVKPSMDRWGVAGPVVFPVLLGLSGGLAGAVVGGLLLGVTGGVGGIGVAARVGAGVGAAGGAVIGAATGHFVGRAFGLYQARQCFDVWADDQQSEFAVAFLFKLFDTRARFWWLMQAFRNGYGGQSRGFPPFIGLTAVTGQDTLDPDQFVRNEYLSLPIGTPRDLPEEGINTPFSRAVAVILGDRRHEQPLRDQLEEFFTVTTTTDGRNLPLKDVDPEAQDFGHWEWKIVKESAYPRSWETKMGAWEYMACLALSWLRARRLVADGTPPDQLGPLLSLEEVKVNLPATWPAPTVPAEAIALVPALPPAIARRGEDVPAFPAAGEGASEEQQRTSDEDVQPVPPPITSVDQRTIRVPESSSLVRLEVPIASGDSLRMRANPNARIWSGVIGHLETGPAGYPWTDQDPKFPLNAHPWRPYSLLYKYVTDPDRLITVTILGTTVTGPRHAAEPWQYLGDQTVQFPAPGDGALFFRTNDDAPGNGGGAFEVNLTLERRS
jgi:hypothetical protein